MDDTKTPGTRKGRRLLLSAAELDSMRALILGHPLATVSELRTELASLFGRRISHATFYNYLNIIGIARTPRESRKDTAARLNATASTAVAPAERESASYGYNATHRNEGNATRYPSSLTDEEWKLVADLFEVKGPGKPPKYPRRLMLDACCYVVRSGCSWRMLPRNMPPWQDVYAHFRRWSEKGLFEEMHDRLRTMWRERLGRSENPSAAVLDSQSVKTSPQGGPKGYDGGKKVKGRKRHIAVDLCGLLLAVMILPANVQDRDGAAPLMEKAMTKYPTVSTVYVDAGYAGKCAKTLEEKHKLAVKVVRRASPAGVWSDKQLSLFEPKPPPAFTVLPKRWVVERTHAWIERPRRMAKDQDRRLDVAESWVWLVQSRILMQRLAEADFTRSTV